jgi:hypothetical protein
MKENTVEIIFFICFFGSILGVINSTRKEAHPYTKYLSWFFLGYTLSYFMLNYV